MKDRLWFFFTGRNWAYDQDAANSFKPDGTQDADINVLESYPFRLTSQLTKNNKLTAMYNWASREKQNFLVPGPTRTPASITGQSTPTEYIAQAKWTSTLTAEPAARGGLQPHQPLHRLSVQGRIVRHAGVLLHGVRALCAGHQLRQHPAPGHPDRGGHHRAVSRHRRRAGTEDRPTESHTPMVSLTYVTGAHALKVGFQDRFGPFRQRRVFNGDIGQQYRNGEPFAVTVLNTPTDTIVKINHDMGIYLQDTWTTKRLTLSPGIRYDHFNSSIPAQTKPAGRFVGEQHFEAIADTPNWHNVVPRIGAAYLFGNGRTAVKGNWGIYMSGQGPGFVQNYNPSFPALDTRTWTY